MVELAYTADLKSAAERLVGSSPTGGTARQRPLLPLNLKEVGAFVVCGYLVFGCSEHILRTNLTYVVAVPLGRGAKYLRATCDCLKRFNVSRVSLTPRGCGLRPGAWPVSDEAFGEIHIS